MAQLSNTAIHGVRNVVARAGDVLTTSTGRSFCSVSLIFDERPEIVFVDVYLPAHRADFARDLADAINAVNAKHAQKEAA